MVEDVFGIVGTTLAGTFHVEEVIAEGGFGVVYRAEHVAFRAPVALKCLKVPGTVNSTQSETFVENFREEAEILFHLSAQIPEVVRPLHADAMTTEDGVFVPYLAMEWIEGKPLDSIVIIREQDGLAPLGLRKVVRMLSPIAHALSRAHRFQVPGGAVVSVTHCDLKPENIVITEKDNPVRAKILDFGIAKARDTMRQRVGRITASEDSRPFTPSYGAPEQWVPKRYGQTGPWTDVWGMALTMVECLIGNPPIDGEMHAMMGTALDKSRRPTPGGEGVVIGEAAERVMTRALAVDPRERYQDIEEFWTAIEAAAGLPSSFARLRASQEIHIEETDGEAPYVAGKPSWEPQNDEFELEMENESAGLGEPMGGGLGDNFDDVLSDADLGLPSRLSEVSAKSVRNQAGTEAELELEAAPPVPPPRRSAARRSASKEQSGEYEPPLEVPLEEPGT
ncbi:MAG: serine/threonine-protein kinase, partial [Myxococcota bacterium]